MKLVHLQNLLIVLAVAAANVALWIHLRQPEAPGAVFGRVHGVSYSPFQGDQSPFEKRFPTPAQMDADLKLLSQRTGLVRTYSVTNGLERIPALAAKYNLQVMPGAWLDKDLARNQLEISRLVKIAWESHETGNNVKALVVGNEAVLRGDLTVAQLVSYIRLVKARTMLPVTTAEPWHIWIKHPELTEVCDFIAGHFLPYWEGVAVDAAVPHVLAVHDILQRTFPDKPILMAEVGWPSAGWRREAAVPTPANQEHFLRQFLHEAQRRNLQYCIMEAFDQPWKGDEGTVGPHWGMFNEHRQPKFVWSEVSLTALPFHVKVALAGALGLILMVVGLRFCDHIVWSGRLFFALVAQAAAATAVITGALLLDGSLGWGTRVGWLVLWPAQLLLLAILLINTFEMVELLWAPRRLRRFAPLHDTPAEHLPMVSIHVPACREPAGLVIKTLRALAKLDYPNFEVLMVSNNTSDPNHWQPLRDECARLGSHFRFFHLEKFPGYKAGALNFALEQTDPRAQVVAVIDCDYLVKRSWLRKTVGYFADPQVGLVQNPQDHRGCDGRLFKNMLNSEYTGFFHLGMVHRNERNAIIQHGTMTMVRRTAMAQVGGWATWCICEDAELGLRLMAQGWQTVYMNHSLGQGVAPDSFYAYKKQRSRWAYGAMRILVGHWRDLLPWRKSGLNAAQKYHFIAGWLPWIGDALGLAFTALSLLWTLGLLLWPHGIGLPIAAMVLPPIGVALFNLIRNDWMYRALVPVNAKQRLLAGLAGLSLYYTIGRSCMAGLFTSSRPFGRTPKTVTRFAFSRCLSAVRDEATIFALLWLGVAGMLLIYPAGRPQTKLWVLALILQSLPFGAAVVSSLIGGLPALAPAVQRLRQRRWNRLAARTTLRLAQLP